MTTIEFVFAKRIRKEYLLLPLFFFLFFSFFTCFTQTEPTPKPQSLQDETSSNKRPTFTVGGGVGFQFGTYNSVELYPMGGIYIKPWLLAQINGQYAYLWRKGYYDSHIWGIGAALQPWIAKKVLLHAGYEFNQICFQWLDGSKQQVMNLHFAVIGVGYKQYLSKTVYCQALILLNIPLNQSTLNSYSYNYYPYFRIGVGVDL